MFGDFLLESFYLFGSFQGLVVVSLLMIKTRSRANIILAVLIALLSIYLFEQVLFLNQGIRKYPHIFYSTLPIMFLIGPALYHFVRLNINSHQGWKWSNLYHLIPFAYEISILIPFYVLPADIKLSIYEYSLQSQGPKQFDQYSFGYLLYVSSTIYFLTHCYRLLKRVSSKRKKDLLKKKILRSIVTVITLYLGFNLLLFITNFFIPGHQNQLLQISPLLLCVLIQVIGFICFLYPDIIYTDHNSTKYVNSGLTKPEVEHLGISLVTVLEEKQMYLNQELEPNELAVELGLSKADLSRVISEGLNTNFYKLINEYRVNKAKKLLRAKEYSDAKLIHIALDSGFSNKTSFLRNFKQIVGMNPSDFRKKELHSIE